MFCPDRKSLHHLIYQRCYHFTEIDSSITRVVPEIRGQVQLVKNLVTYLYKMYRVFISMLLEVNCMKIVEIIMCTLTIAAKVAKPAQPKKF